MKQAVIDIILINAYWFSLPLIGYSFLSLGKWSKAPRPLKDVNDILNRQHPLVAFVMSFAVAVLSLGLLSVVFYLFHLPALDMVIIYLAALTVSVGFVISQFARRLFSKPGRNIFWAADETLLVRTVFIIMCAMLIADFLISLYLRAYADGDAIYHMSRVVDILSQGFNVNSSFYSSLPEGAYHYNVVYALYVIPSKLFGLEPMRVWEFSLSFFRMVQWLGVFTLAVTVFKRWLKAEKLTLMLASLSVISAISFFAFNMYTANYPNKLVLVWLMLLVVAMSYLRESNRKVVGAVMLGLGALITLTHPSFGMITSSIIILVAVVRLVVDRKEFLARKWEIAIYGMTVIVLMIGPLVSKLLPVRLTGKLLNLNPAPMISVLGLDMLKPRAIPTDYINATLYYLGALSLIYLAFRLWKDKRYWSIAVSVLTLYLIIGFVPPAFSIVKLLIPVWLITNFSSANILSYLFIVLGICGLLGIFLKIRGIHFDANKPNKTYSVVLATAVLVVSALAAPISYKEFINVTKTNPLEYSQMQQTTKDFKSILKDEKVVVAKPNYSYYISSLFPVDVVSITFGHATLASDGEDRAQCLSHILGSYEYSDLSTVNASYVLTNLGNNVSIPRIESKPYLKLVKSTPDFLLYRFDSAAGRENIKPFAACSKYKQNERT